MSHVRVETKDRILRIELARPEKKNALSPDMYQALAGAFGAADADAGVRVILIHGTSGCFTSGNDVRDFLELDRGPADSPASGFLRAIAAANKPVVAAVGGPAAVRDPLRSAKRRRQGASWLTIGYTGLA